MNARKNITDIQDERIRNLVRGLLVRTIDASTIRTYNKIRAKAPGADTEVVSELLLRNPLFAHLHIAEDFPKAPRFIESLTRYDDQSLSGELIFQGVRIRENADKLLPALRDLRLLNQALIAERPDEILLHLKKFIDEYGYSFIILSKLAYVTATFGSDESLQRYCSEELEKHNLGRKSAIALAAVDMMGKSYRFLQLRQNLMEFANRRASEFTRDVLKWQFRPIRFLGPDVSSTLQSLGLNSLIDALIFILVHRFNVDIFDRLSVSAVIDQYIPDAIITEWKSLAGEFCPAREIRNTSEEPEFDDFTFYRRSLAWIEYKSVSLFRHGIDPLYLETAASDAVMDRSALAFQREYFCDVISLASLASAPKSISQQLERYRNDEAGTFLRTVAFVYLVRTGARSTDVTSDQLLTILNWTRDISRVSSASELKTFFEGGMDDLLARYLACALIFDSSESTFDQHRLRRALEMLVQERFDGELLKFARFLALESKHVAIHLFETCTEAFLIQLFHLLPTAESVFETRAQLFEWYAELENEPAWLDRAKTLRLDEKLRKVRGEINDNRIYVDPVRFHQWIADTLFEELSSIFRGGVIDDSALDDLTGSRDTVSYRSPALRLVAVIQTAYAEFCSNKRWGVDSYLGRRIRHGTLRGFMIAQLESIFDKPYYARIMARPAAAEYIRRWLSNYDAALEDWGTEVFHVNSKAKIKGAIHPRVNSHGKLSIVRSAIIDIAKANAERNNLIVVSQVIIDYCWILLEKDLAPLRRTIEAGRVGWGTIERRSLVEACSDLTPLCGELCREVNALTDEKFRTLSRWFTKPANASPSTTVELLIDAVLSEVREHFPDYAPAMRREGLPNIQLFGMYYHNLYDFLYVVIFNAAKHGKRVGGELAQSIRLADGQGSARNLQIEISSEIKDEDDIEQVRHEIEAAMAGSIDDAMVVEKKSGLKKLRQLQADVRDISVIDVSYGARDVTWHCSMTIKDVT